eukprot:CAMPEP_0113845560 /NCGR_PEP_ID=MMETSP0372-20130328/824_1 /TAXON_ID=340204 /ORGANISM="Lankesteria abbotti" /LENGTH=81 /DNA_ID=CAMNT_0000814615 /DNA_START=1189 /DNA_END=1434 /DNA_ORIENTATION=- /assembly_acc=CAM_ASM_000359
MINQNRNVSANIDSQCGGDLARRDSFDLCPPSSSSSAPYLLMSGDGVGHTKDNAQHDDSAKRYLRFCEQMLSSSQQKSQAN